MVSSFDDTSNAMATAMRRLNSGLSAHAHYGTTQHTTACLHELASH
jgi:hypothetical protein